MKNPYPRAAACICLLWAMLIVLFSANTLASKVDLSGRKKFCASLVNRCWQKESFVSLNGAWTRFMGRRICNRVTKMANGYLMDSRGRIDIRFQAASLDNLATFCRTLGVRPLFVMTPNKIDLGNELPLKGGLVNESNGNADRLLAALRAMPALDTRKDVSETPDDIARNFFATDHHWNFTGAFKAFPAIARRICRELDSEPPDLPQFEAENWQPVKLDRQFLGSYGRRTGPYFAGMDSIEYYVPRFHTEMVRFTPELRLDRRRSDCATGTFERVCIDKNVMMQPKSVFADRAYSLYGGDFSENRLFNAVAPIRKRLCIVKDSYALPVIAYLSTVFSEIYTLDIRHYKQSDAATYIRNIHPDAVVVMYTSKNLHPKPFFDFVDGNYAVDGEGHEIGKIEEIGIKPSTSPFNRHQIINNLVPGSDVRVSVGKLEPREGRPDSASLILYNSTHKKVVSKRLAYANLGQTQTFIFHVPEKPGRYSLLAYAGKAGMTDGIGVVWRDIVIEGTKSKDKKPQGQEP